MISTLSTVHVIASILKCTAANFKRTPRFLNSRFNSDANSLLKKNFLSYHVGQARSKLCTERKFSPDLKLHRTVSDMKQRKEVVFSETYSFEDEQCDRVQGKWNTEQKRILDETVSRGSPSTVAEWQDLREKILSISGFITEKNIDALVIAACIVNKQLSIGISYLRYLSSVGRSLNVATAGGFFKLCSVCREEAVVDEDMVLSVYDNLRSACPLLDAHTAQNAILGLCLTDRWKESFELLETVKITATPNAFVFNELVRAAFTHNEPDVGWSLMNELLHYDKKPMPGAYKAWIGYCSSKGRSSGVKLLDQLLHFMAHNDLRPTRAVAELSKESYIKLSSPETEWVGISTHVTHRGTCKSCGKLLPVVSLTSEEFEKLREVFLKNVLIGRNVFLKTTPVELEEFRCFLQSCRPYNIVIDGLNVAFSGKKNERNTRILAGFIQAVVKHFLGQSKTVLVLGRKHMTKWPQNIMEYVYRNAQVFLAQNLSQDDPFLLYAAMHGGLGTGFVSRDLMRGHAFLLKDATIRSSFRLWQQQHQYQLLYVENNGRVRLKQPLQYNPSVQQAGDGSWHIPYDEDSTNQSAQSLEPPISWLCLKKV